MCDDDVKAQIEAKLNRYTDHLDRMLAEGHISQDDYVNLLKDLDRWAEAKAAEVLQ